MGSERTLMDRYLEGCAAESRLEEAVCEAIGGKDWWQQGNDGLPFEDWYFDWYDSSVELLGTRAGWEPNPDQLAKLHEAGIWSVYVSYRGAVPDTYTATLWHWRRDEGAWSSGPCGAREPREKRDGLVRDLYQHMNALLSTAKYRFAMEAEEEAHVQSCAYCSGPGRGCGWEGWGRLIAAEHDLRKAIEKAEGR